MLPEYKIRPARAEDAREIASLIAISSDGVATIEWHEQAVKEACDPLDIGERNYQNRHADYSYSNATIVDKNNQVAGMLLTFRMPDAKPGNPQNRPGANDKNVFAPYIYLQQPNSWYICGVAFYPQHRDQGPGSRLTDLANEQARENGLTSLSLVVFEQNKGAVRLYEKLGYQVVDRAPVVPHRLIRYDGDALLMTRFVSLRDLKGEEIPGNL